VAAAVGGDAADGHPAEYSVDRAADDGTERRTGHLGPPRPIRPSLDHSTWTLNLT
jgi:hypothetical protein